MSAIEGVRAQALAAAWDAHAAWGAASANFGRTTHPQAARVAAAIRHAAALAGALEAIEDAMAGAHETRILQRLSGAIHVVARHGTRWVVWTPAGDGGRQAGWRRCASAEAATPRGGLVPPPWSKGTHK